MDSTIHCAVAIGDTCCDRIIIIVITWQGKKMRVYKKAER